MHELRDSITVKLLPPPLDLQKAVVKATHVQGLPAVRRAVSFQGAVDLLSCELDDLTHSFIYKPASDQHIVSAKRNNSSHGPTLTVCASQTREGDEMQVKFHNDLLAKRMLFDSTSRQPLGLGNDESRVGNACRSARDMCTAGISMMVGSDSSGQARGSQFGLGVYMEILAMIHKAGIVIDVLISATSLIADRFGFDDKGRIKGDVREFLAKEENLCLPMCGVWRDGVALHVYEDVVN
jgi:hypothetical protein